MIVCVGVCMFLLVNNYLKTEIFFLEKKDSCVMRGGARKLMGN